MSPEQPSILIATYPSRRDAEMARDRLAQEKIDAIVTADDAGGMHPEMQLANSVRLQVRSDQSERAHQVLERSNMLAAAFPPPEEIDEEISIWRDLGIAFVVMGLFLLLVGFIVGRTTVVWMGICLAAVGVGLWYA